MHQPSRRDTQDRGYCASPEDAGAGDWKGAPLNPQMGGRQLSLQSTLGTPVLTEPEAASKVSCAEQIAAHQKPGRATD